LSARALAAVLAAAIAAAIPIAPRPAAGAERAPGAAGSTAIGSTAAAVAPAPADRALLARVIEESRVDTRRPDPGWAAYVRELIRRVAVALGQLLRDLGDSVGIPAGAVRAIVWALAAVAVAAIAAAVVVLVRRRRRGAAPAATAGGVGAAEPPPAAVDWRAEIDRRLAAGRIAEALEAAWWWLARALCGERAEASWTGGELVARGRRPDVAPAVARLDAMTYGPRRPAPAEVRALIERLEQRLAVAPGTAP
jgi:hypothetical protein